MIIDFLFLNTNSFLCQMQTFFVATTLYLLFLQILDLLWNIEKLKCFTFLDPKEILIPLLGILPCLEALSSFLKISGDISVFSFNQKLLFRQYIDFYSNKEISTIKCMKMLGNSNRGLNPLQKR